MANRLLGCDPLLSDSTCAPNKVIKGQRRDALSVGHGTDSFFFFFIHNLDKKHRSDPGVQFLPIIPGVQFLPIIP